jgi:pentatricopeptide repeat protein
LDTTNGNVLNNVSYISLAVGTKSLTSFSLYAKFDVETAHGLFEHLPKEGFDIQQWTTMLDAFGKSGKLQYALEIFDQMKRRGFQPDSITYTCLLTACANAVNLEHGKRIHNDIIKNRVNMTVNLHTALVNMYGKCGRLDTACDIAMNSHHTEPTVFASLFAACANHGDIQRGVAVHEYIIKRGIVLNLNLFTSLINMYGKIGGTDKALIIFDQMKQHGVEPNAVTYNCLLTACVRTGDINRGKLLHEEMLKQNVIPTIELQNTLINLYGSCGELEMAFNLYDQFKKLALTPDDVTYTCLLTACTDLSNLSKGQAIHRDIISRRVKISVSLQNAIINLYGSCGSLATALELFDQMKLSGMKPDHVTYTCLLKACGDQKNLQAGKLLHEEALNNGVKETIAFQTAAISMYYKCDEINIALEYFNRLKLDTGLNQDTYSFMLTACAEMTMLEEGKEIHLHMLNSGIKITNTLKGALIHMYSKCGAYENALSIFDEMRANQGYNSFALMSYYL